MSDTLEIFGTEYTGVTGIKATDDNGQTKTYIRPQGTKQITSNGTGIDVSAYATADVAVPSGDTIFLITLSYNDQTEMWEPDCTYAQVAAAYQAGKTIEVDTDLPSEDATADGEFIGEFNRLTYWVHVYNGGGIDETQYDLASTGLTIENHTTYVVEPNMTSVSLSYTPTESQQTDTQGVPSGYDGISEVEVTVGAISSSYVGSGITRRDSTDLSASGATVSAPAGYYASSASKSVTSGSATPASSISATGATLTTGTNTLTLSKSVSNTPQVSAGYVSSGTAGNSSVSLTASVTTQAAQTIYPSTSDQTISSGRYLTGTQTVKAVTTTNLTADNIKQGVTVQVGDSSDSDRVASVTGTYSGGGGSLSYDTKTATASNYPVSLSFSSMKGEPKFFSLRLNAQVSSSGNTTYYYIVNITSNCNGSSATTHGNCFRIGSTRRVDNITSGYSWSYSGTTLTITSSAASRSASPGAFYSGSYELLYAY